MRPTFMKLCTYCGRENEDAAVACRECGAGEFKDAASEERPATESESLPLSALDFVPLAPEEMQMRFVTLLKCRTLLEADMIVGQLDSAGINAFIPDEFLMQSVAWHLNTYGFVRVQVPPAQYEAAKAFLLASPADA
jgi:hypothetical protein